MKKTISFKRIALTSLHIYHVVHILKVVIAYAV